MILKMIIGRAAGIGIIWVRNLENEMVDQVHRKFIQSSYQFFGSNTTGREINA